MCRDSWLPRLFPKYHRICKLVDHQQTLTLKKSHLKKPWVTPVIEILDSDNVSAKANNLFREAGANNGNFYIIPGGSPAPRLTVAKAAYDQYVHS